MEEIRHDYEEWHQRKLESARRSLRQGEGESDILAKKERIASLDVMGVSALEGYGLFDCAHRKLITAARTGVRAAVDWLFIRVQNSRRQVFSFCT